MGGILPPASGGQHVVGNRTGDIRSELLVWQFWLVSTDAMIVCVYECTFSTDFWLLVADRLFMCRAQSGVVMILLHLLGGFDVRGISVWDV